MWSEWSTAQIALVVSGMSFALAFASFIWNVWSKFIYPKPKLGVSIRMSVLVGVEQDQPVVTLDAVNHGPGEVVIKSAIGIASKKWPWFRTQRALLKCYVNWPHSFQEAAFGECPNLPMRLAVGDSYRIYYPTAPFASGEISNLALVDGFNREHGAPWSSRRRIKVTREANK